MSNFDPRHLLTPLALAALWWLLTGGEAGAWLVGIPAVLAAAWAARRLRQDGHSAISLPGLLRFLPFFAWESLRGGIDVAQRTLSPQLRVNPGFISYRTKLPQRSARIIFANCMCLLPGTLAADLQGDLIEVHLLDTQLDVQADFARLEQAVAAVYRESPAMTPGPSV